MIIIRVYNKGMFCVSVVKSVMQNAQTVMRKKHREGSLMKMNRQLNAGISKGAFTRYLEVDKKQYLISDRDSHSSTLISGEFLSYQVPNGYLLQGGETDELINFQVVSTVQKSMNITILLKGVLDFGYDNKMFHLDSSTENSAIVVNLARPVNFYRSIHENNHVVKLNISIPLNWIADRGDMNDLASSFVKQHLDYFKLTLTEMMFTLSHEIIRLGSPTNFMDKLQLEVLSKSLIFEVFKQLKSNETSKNSQQIVKTEQQVLKSDSFDQILDGLLRHIESNLDQPLSVQQLAQFSAMSLSNLQRKFKQTLGYSIQGYIRRRRLEIAKQALEKGLISITEAAYNAGYRHPSNFTNAFKKTFGFAPREITKI
jgi:AraC-like DNA-binding protein